jgi:hypothetical protein
MQPTVRRAHDSTSTSDRLPKPHTWSIAVDEFDVGKLESLADDFDIVRPEVPVLGLIVHRRAAGRTARLARRFSVMFTSARAVRHWAGVIFRPLHAGAPAARARISDLQVTGKKIAQAVAALARDGSRLGLRVLRKRAQIYPDACCAIQSVREA